MMIPIAVQLYTLRDLTKTDFAGTVRQVAEIGYAGVELAGFGNLASAGEVRKVLNDCGLKIAGAHVGIEQLEKDLSRVLDEQRELGNRNIVVPWMPEVRRKDAAGWKEVGASLNAIARQCAERGFNLAYHNHSFEFQTFDGQSGLDILFASSEASLVRSELDVYWVKHGGLDPVRYMDKLGRRMLLVHLKDMAGDAERRFAPVGEGILDFKAILAATQRHGAQWGIVEQDNTYGQPPIEAIRRSYENIRVLSAAG